MDIVCRGAGPNRSMLIVTSKIISTAKPLTKEKIFI